jgi:hypothetical protein
MLSIEGIAGDSILLSHASLPGFVWFAANSAQLSKPIPSLLVRIGQSLVVQVAPPTVTVILAPGGGPLR